MADVVSAKTRSRMMAGIKAKDTKPELTIRRGLHAAGFRYRLHSKKLPGKPDLVFPRWKAVVFVNGCFWHRHDCHLFKLPSTRTEFWETKINGNVRRDREAFKTLLALGWRVGVVWECALKGRERRFLRDVIGDLSDWLRGTGSVVEIRGHRVD